MKLSLFLSFSFLFVACAGDGSGDTKTSSSSGAPVPDSGPGVTAPIEDPKPAADAASTYPPFGAATFLKASNTGMFDTFGSAISLSADGKTLAVGAIGEGSGATGIDQDQADDSASLAGAVYVFVWSGSAWSQQAYVKASNTSAGDMFGFSVSLSADGSRLAVGAPSEDSSATGVNQNQADDAAPESGAVYVFARTGTTWAQEAYVKASNTGVASAIEGDAFGASVSISGDGTRLAVGAFGEESNATGIDQDQSDNSLRQAGAVYVFARSGATWAQEAYVKASNTGAIDWFGRVVSLSADGALLVVGAPCESSNGKGVGANQTDDSANASGAVYVFARSGATWTQEAYVKASNTSASNNFGVTVAVSADGTRFAVGATLEHSSATGIDGNGNQDVAPQNASGAVYVFARSGTTWAQEAYVKASNTWSNTYFGRSLSFSADGRRLIVGSDHEDSGATGIDGKQTDGSAPDSGAAYVFSRDGSKWTQDAYVKASNTGSFDEFGWAVSMSGDGTKIAVSARLERSAATGVGGAQNDDTKRGSGAVYVY